MEILKKEKGNPWLKRLLNFEIRKKYPVEFKSKNTVRSIISSEILDNYPDMEFTTQKAEVEIDGKTIKYLEVERLK